MLFVVLCGFIIVLFLFAIFISFSLDRKIVYKNLKGKHVVVTGGSSGIGKGAAKEAARLEAHVTVIGRDITKLISAVKDIANCAVSKNQKIQYAVLDVTSEYPVIEKCLSQLEVDLGPIFMLINSAGMCICGQYDEMEVNDIKHMINLNYFGTAYCTRYVLPKMKKRKEGLLVFVSSEAALIGIYGYSAYSAAKWAVRGLAESVMMELIGTNVRLTLAFPPDTNTPGFANEELSKPKETKLISSTGGLHEPDDVGKNLLHDSLNGEAYSTFGASGKLMSLLNCSTITSANQVIIQMFTMGPLRAIMACVMLSFHKIVRDCLKEKTNETVKTK